MLLGACSRLGFLAVNVPTAFGSFQRTSDLAYGSEARQHLDVYAPRARSKRRPIVVFFYGGSWSAGKKSEYKFVGAALAERGFVTVIPDYRIYPQVLFPSFMQDAARATAWVEHHGADFGGDPARIVLMGHSAGAQIAALLALDPTYLSQAGVPSRNIVGLIGLSGPYALAPDSDLLRTIFAPPFTPNDWQPVRFAHRGAPATLLLHGIDDKVVYVEHTIKLRDALLADGVPVETRLYPGRGHADTIASFSLIARSRTTALADTIDFLHRLGD